VTADRAYVRESIVAPGTKIVRGYLPLMPSYRAYLDDQQLDALVSHVEQLSQRGAADGGTAEQTRAAVVVDPVCHMDVRVTDDTPHATHEGHEYYFCAESCRKRFIADPEQFLNAPER
jgi:YHS domain-containing protein